MNPDLLDYKIMSVHEMPDVVPIIVESNDPEGPFGAKEAGEGPLLPMLPAGCNAISCAATGYTGTAGACSCDAL